MADETPTTFTEEGARRIVEEILRTSAQPRNDFGRRRRHVTAGGGGSSDVRMFRLEEELAVGRSAQARLMDPSGVTTLPGSTVTVMDDERKWFGRGNAAPSGDSGGDGRRSGQSISNIGWGIKVNGDETFYSILSMGTWYRYISGTLAPDQETHPWRVYLEGDNATIGDAWDGDANDQFGPDVAFVRPDDVQDSGEDLYLTLDGICVEPVDGMEFRAVFDELVRQYRVFSICCSDEEE